MFASSCSVSFSHRSLSYLFSADERLPTAVSVSGALQTKACLPLCYENHHPFANTGKVNYRGQFDD